MIPEILIRALVILVYYIGISFMLFDKDMIDDLLKEPINYAVVLFGMITLFFMVPLYILY